MGSILLDDEDGTIYLLLIMKLKSEMPEGRDVEFSRNSTGVYIGKLKDIDDMTKFYPS